MALTAVKNCTTPLLKKTRESTAISPEFLVDTFKTQLGWMAILAKNERLAAFSFGHTTAKKAQAAVSEQIKASSPYAQIEQVEWMPELAERLTLFAAGEPQDFSDVLLDTSHLTTFAAKVIAQCRELSWGTSVTYGELAKRAGASGAARAVGSVMAKNRFPLIVPCHRVLPAGGKLGGFSAPQGVSMKKRLLQMEGTWEK